MERALNDRIAVIGLGSPIMSDDAVGLEIAQRIEDLGMEGVDTMQEAVGGLELLPLIRGYRHVIVTDAIQTGGQPPGTVMIYDLDDFEDTVGNTFAHDINLATAIRIGEQMDPSTMPEKVIFVAVEVADIVTMSETMTEEVEAAVGPAVNAVLYMMERLRSPDATDRSG
jgi:hydrogenase maturation protease